MVQYRQCRIDLPPSPWFLLEVNGKFWFNSESTVEPFALKAEKRKWYLRVPLKKKKDKMSTFVEWCYLVGLLREEKNKTTYGSFWTGRHLWVSRSTHTFTEVAHSWRLPWCRDCCERSGFRHICHCERMNSEFTCKQSALASLLSRARWFKKEKWCTSKMLKWKQKGNIYEIILYSYA